LGESAVSKVHSGSSKHLPVVEQAAAQSTVTIEKIFHGPFFFRVAQTKSVSRADTPQQIVTDVFDSEISNSHSQNARHICNAQ
jgi:hypothetical protein